MIDKRNYVVTWTVELRAESADQAAEMARYELFRKLENRVAPGLELRVTPAGGKTVWVDL